MWSFYYRPSKQKAGRRQNELFGHSIFKLQDTLKCLWLQSLLLFLFCLDCSCAPTESQSGSLSHAELLHVKPNFLKLNIAHTPEKQQSVTPIPVWKPEVLKRWLKALRAHSIMKVSSHKLHKHGRPFKRDLENLSQKNGSSLYELASTLTEMLRKMQSHEALYVLPDVENTKTVTSSKTRSLSSFSGEHIRIGLLNDTTLDHLLKTPYSATVLTLDSSETWAPPPNWGPLSDMQTPASKSDNVSQMHVFSVDPTFAAVGQMRSMQKHSTFAKPEDMSSIDSLNKEQTDAPNIVFLPQSDSTLPLTQGFPYGEGKRIAKFPSYTDLPGSPFAVTEETTVLTENSSHQSTTFTLKASSGYAIYGLDVLPNSALKAVKPYSAIHSLATDWFNLLDTSAHPKHETSTFSNIIPSLETSTVKLQHIDVPVNGISQTNPTSASSALPVNTDLYSQNTKPLSALLFDFPDVHHSVNLRKDNLDLQSVTPQALDIVGLSSNKSNVEAKTSLNTDHDTADISHMTTPSMGNSPVVDGTPVSTFFASSNSTLPVEQDLFFDAWEMDGAENQTSERDRILGQQRGTSRTFSASTLLPQEPISTGKSHSVSYTDINTLSSVAPSPDQVKVNAWVLQIHDPANTQMPKSETLRLPTVYKSNEYESDTTVLTSNSVTSNDGSMLVEGTFTDAQSELGFQSMTPSFEYDSFNDVMNENGIIRSTFNLTSTLSSTLSSAWTKKPLTTVASLWKSRTSHQYPSTVEHVQKINTPRSTLYSTEANEGSRRVNATGGQVHAFHKVSNASLPVSTRSSLDLTTILSTLQRTKTKFVPELETSSVKTSTNNNLVSKIHSIRDQMTARQTLSSSRQPQTASSKTMKPLITSLTSLSRSSKITSAITFATMIVTPAPKAWIPQRVSPLKATIATHTNYSTGQKISSVPTTTKPVVTMPLKFHITGVSFSEQLTNRTSEEYRKLEREAKLVMDRILFAKYQNDYLDTEIKAFLKGSVIVIGNIVFQSNNHVPSASDIIRTILTDGTKTNYFGWSINGSTVELNGYTSSNLELEILPISFLVLRVGYIAVSQNNQEKQSFLANLQKAVFYAVGSFPITNVSILEIRDVFGDLKVRGNLYFNSTVHTNVQSLLSSLFSLVNRSVDLSSIIVNGIGKELQVYSISFRVTNKKFVLNLLDMSSSESQLLGKNLSTVVQSVLQDSNPLQVVMREFQSGSIVCRGDIMYLLPAPGSSEILRLLLKNLGSDGTLGSSTYKVDFKSITIGDSSPGLYNEYVDFPGFGVAIIVMCGLGILIFPILLIVCTKTRILGHRQKATIQRRHDPVDQSHHFEMDNQAFRASIEQP